MAISMKFLAAGRFVYAVGSDAEAARLAGIRPQLTTFYVFVLMGALTGRKQRNRNEQQELRLETENTEHGPGQQRPGL